VPGDDCSSPHSPRPYVGSQPFQLCTARLMALACGLGNGVDGCKYSNVFTPLYVSETPSTAHRQACVDVNGQPREYPGSPPLHTQRLAKMSRKFYIRSPQWSSVVESTSARAHETSPALGLFPFRMVWVLLMYPSPPAPSRPQIQPATGPSRHTAVTFDYLHLPRLRRLLQYTGQQSRQR